MASTNGYAGAKLDFRSSEVKKNTEFYKNYVADKLTEENFKWPECPCKFITRNHLIGAIQSPNRSEIEYTVTDGPESPSISDSVPSSPQPSTSNLLNDMVKLIKGEKKDESKSEVATPKTEAPLNPNPYFFVLNGLPFGMNTAMMSMPNLPNMSMLGIPSQTPNHVSTVNSKNSFFFADVKLASTEFLINFIKPWGCPTPVHNSVAASMMVRLLH